MLRTYVLSGVCIAQGVITDVPAEQIQQAILLAPSLAEAKAKLLTAIDEEDTKTFQFTDQCREVCENDILQTTFEGWLQPA